MTRALRVRGDQTHQWVQQVNLIARHALLRSTAQKQVVRSVLKTQHPHQHQKAYSIVHASRETKAVGDKFALRASWENSRLLGLVFVNLAPLTLLRMLLLVT